MQLARKLSRGFRSLLVQQDGPTASEYAILLALLVLVAVAAIGGIGSRVYNVYANIDAAVEGAAGM